MTTCVDKINFDLGIVDDIDTLNEMSNRLNSVRKDSIEHLCLQEEFSKLESKLDLQARQQKNLFMFNKELYSHGVRRWAFNGPFVVTTERVHNDREHRFIYVPVWSVTEDFGIPSGCGNSNQRQFNKRASLYFGDQYERMMIEILDKDGKFIAKTFNEVSVPSHFNYWMDL